MNLEDMKKLGMMDPATPEFMRTAAEHFAATLKPAFPEHTQEEVVDALVKASVLFAESAAHIDKAREEGVTSLDEFFEKNQVAVNSINERVNQLFVGAGFDKNQSAAIVQVTGLMAAVSMAAKMKREQTPE